MVSQKASLRVFFLFAFIVLAQCTLFSSNETAYELIEEYHLPSNLLPDTVTGYTLNNETGEFEVYLESACSTTVDNGNIGVYYAQTITGVVTVNKLSSLTGIKVKPLWIWLKVTEIYVDDPPSGYIHFVVWSGLSEAVKISTFDNRPICSSSYSLSSTQRFFSFMYNLWIQLKEFFFGSGDIVGPAQVGVAYQ